MADKRSRRQGAGAGLRHSVRTFAESAALRRLRRRCYEVLERDSAHDRLAERVNFALIALIFANVMAAILETVPSLALHDRVEFHVFELLSLVVFAIEYLLRIWVAPENPRYRGLSVPAARRRYALTPTALVDLVAWLPFVLSPLFGLDLRTLAILRLVRFVKLVRYSPGMQSLLEVLRSERQSLLACFWLVLGAVLISASAMYLAERSVQPDKFGSIPAAMWWAITTVTTVGYGDAYPISVPGRMIGAFTMLTGLIMLALPVGIIATAFVEVIKRRDFVVTWGMVARVPLFADLDAAGIGEIHRLLSSHIAENGDVIVRRGQIGRSMYFIASGEVEVELPDGPVLIGEGDFFGELALIRNTSRSATVRAHGRCMLLALDGADLDELIHRRPQIGQRIRAHAKRADAPEAVEPKGDLAVDEVADMQPANDAKG
ncbi:MAG: putative transcriptional regulator, Crp/Fnr family [Xanthobacteraceae bacterium]|jgi:voltage-gated potassium channel|nr:putative transcriptional regulator, Crp/Fnr family [Xanthobacteraceae bacterium]